MGRLCLRIQTLSACTFNLNQVFCTQPDFTIQIPDENQLEET